MLPKTASLSSQKLEFLRISVLISMHVPWTNVGQDKPCVYSPTSRVSCLRLSGEAVDAPAGVVDDVEAAQGDDLVG